MKSAFKAIESGLTLKVCICRRKTPLILFPLKIERDWWWNLERSHPRRQHLEANAPNVTNLSVLLHEAGNLLEKWYRYNSIGEWNSAPEGYYIEKLRALTSQWSKFPDVILAPEKSCVYILLYIHTYDLVYTECIGNHNHKPEIIDTGVNFARKSVRVFCSPDMYHSGDSVESEQADSALTASPCSIDSNRRSLEWVGVILIIYISWAGHREEKSHQGISKFYFKNCLFSFLGRKFRARSVDTLGIDSISSVIMRCTRTCRAV